VYRDRQGDGDSDLSGNGDVALDAARTSLTQPARYSRFLAHVIGPVLLLGCVTVAQAQTLTVASGLNSYKNVTQPGAPNPCSGCHMNGVPPNAAGGSVNHLNASNNPVLLKNGLINGAAIMGVTFSPLPSDAVIQTMAMYIGQFKAPALTGSSAATALVRSSGNVAATVDVYPRLLTNGTSGVPQDGGVSVVSAPNAASTSVSVVDGVNVPRYNLTYNPSATLGADTLTFRFVNPASPGGVDGTVAVTVVGISSGNLTTTTASAVNYPINVMGSVPTSYSITSGTLPSGLTLSTTTGVISGTPDANTSGTYPLRLQAITPAGSVDKDVTFTVVGVRLNGANSGAVPAVITGTQTVVLATQTFSTNGTLSGVNPFSVSAGTLPSGLTLNTANGQVTGTPTNGGNTNVTLSVVTTAGTVVLPVQFQIAFGGTPVVTGPTTASGTVGIAINAPGVQLVATNPMITSYVVVSGMPPGLSLNTGNGQITGIPTQSQSSGNSNVFSVLVNATNGVGTGSDATLSFTINPGAVPAVSNATLTPSQNVAFSYDVRAGNVTNLPVSVPITGFSASGLPTGLSINAAGVISGMTVLSGPFTALITASNGLGPSTSATFTINVTPTLVPGITSPTAGSGTAPAPFPATPIVATNPPITGYSGTGLPPGLSVHPVTGIISGTPTTPGMFNATLSATNASGTGTRAVTFLISALPPTAGAVGMTVPLNTPATLDLAPSIGGFGVTGVSIVNAPMRGAVTVSGTRVTYTPAHNYFGTDEFSYVGFGAGGTSPPGTVSITVVGRPDPAQDPTVTGLLTAQADTARRFARTQISNFQRRMESLHRRTEPAGGGSPQGTAGSSVPATAMAAAAPPAKVNPPLDGMGTVAALPGVPEIQAVRGGNGLVAPQPFLRMGQAPVDSAGMSPGGGSSVGFLFQLANDAQMSLKTRSINLAALAGPGATAPGEDAGGFSWWIDGVASFGSRDATGSSSGFNFSTNGISMGFDGRYSEQLTLGAGVGFANDRSRIGTDGSESRADAYTVAVYGSYLPTRNTFVDALLGYTRIDMETARFVAPANDFARGSRSGKQLFGSIAAGYEHREKGLLVSPYGRLDLVVDRLNQSTETGAGQYALTFFGQKQNSVQGALGVRAESQHATSFGRVAPRVRMEFRHDFEGERLATMAYADLLNGPRYAVATGPVVRDALVFGIGSDFIFRGGLTIGADYELQRSHEQNTNFAVRLRVSKALDGRGAASTDWLSAPLDIQVDAGYLFDDNVGRGKVDQLGDQAYSVNVSKVAIFRLNANTRAMVTGLVGGEKFRNYDKLSRVTVGANGDLQYRASGEFAAPTYAVFARAAWDDYESVLRSGYRYTAGVSLSQQLTDRIRLFGALAHNERHGESAVFINRDNAARINLDYALAPRQTLYIGGEYRRGDVVSGTSNPALEDFNIAKVLVRDDAFPGRFFSYRFDGATVITTLGYNLGLGSRDSLDFSWRRIESTPDQRPFFATSPRSYIVNQYSLVYLMRF